jgi:hypothetical protein
MLALKNIAKLLRCSGTSFVTQINYSGSQSGKKIT